MMHATACSRFPASSFRLWRSESDQLCCLGRQGCGDLSGITRRTFSSHGSSGSLCSYLLKKGRDGRSHNASQANIPIKQRLVGCSRPRPDAIAPAAQPDSNRLLYKSTKLSLPSETFVPDQRGKSRAPFHFYSVLYCRQPLLLHRRPLLDPSRVAFLSPGALLTDDFPPTA
jgi:hypothetical protein